MSKIALITDTHMDCRNGSEVFLESQLKFFRNTFVKTLKEQNIDTIIHLGDFTDNPSKISVRSKNVIIDLFENEFKDFNWYIIYGNHDLPIRSNTRIGSTRFLKQFPNVNIIDEITKVEIHNKEILLVPWQHDLESFRLKVSDKNTSCEICMGHFPINGFYMNAKKVCTDEIDAETFFNNFKMTFSGHFHDRDLKKSGDSIIQYIGNPFHLNRSDSNSNRGFVILDLDTSTYEFVDNEESIRFFKLKFPEDISKVPIKGNIIDVEYEYDDNSDEDSFQAYLKSIEEQEPLYPPYPKRLNKTESIYITNENIELESKSNKTILYEYIEKYINKDLKKTITEKIDEYYNECLKGDINE